MSKKSIVFVILIGLFIMGCEYNPLDVDASEIDLEINFENVDATISTADSTNLIEAKHKYQADYKGVYDYLVGYCLQIGEVNDTAFFNSISKYRLDPGVQELSASVQKLYPNIPTYNEEILTGFKHLRYHLNEVKTPKNVVYINSLFASSVYCSEEDVAIGLERYLGEKDSVIQKLNPIEFHAWIKKGMDEKFLTRDAITGWIETHIVEDGKSTIAEEMIRWGKILYLTEAAFPEKEQATILRYSVEDLQWADENIFSFWQYLVDQNLLYSTDPRIIANLLRPGPTTTGLPVDGAPDRLGRYLGWKMVHQYIEFNELTVQDVVDADYKDILLNFEID